MACPVCLEHSSRMLQLSCSHPICRDCLRRMRAIGLTHTCPLCRATLPTPHSLHATAARLWCRLHSGSAARLSPGGERTAAAEIVRCWRAALDEDPHHAGALVGLGSCYRDGVGLGQDKARALGLYQLAADRGVPEAWHNLGVCHETGQTPAGRPDPALAREYYHRAVDAGHLSSAFPLALLYESEQDMTRAVELYEQAVSCGEPMAMFNLAQCYREGRGVDRDRDRMMELYRSAAEAGDPDAQYNLAHLHAEGRELALDLKQAVELYQAAAVQGHSKAAWNLALAYRDGLGVAADSDKAAVLFGQLADAGDPRAAVHLARACEDGLLGMPKDQKRAVELYQAAAKGSSEHGKELELVQKIARKIASSPAFIA